MFYEFWDSIQALDCCILVARSVRIVQTRWLALIFFQLQQFCLAGRVIFRFPLLSRLVVGLGFQPISLSLGFESASAESLLIRFKKLTLSKGGLGFGSRGACALLVSEFGLRNFTTLLSAGSFSSFNLFCRASEVSSLFLLVGAVSEDGATEFESCPFTRIIISCCYVCINTDSNGWQFLIRSNEDSKQKFGPQGFVPTLMKVLCCCPKMHIVSLLHRLT